MRIGLTSNIHLTYCMNVHPGENWADTFSAIKRFPPAVKGIVSPHKPFGLGLRIGCRAACELQQFDNMDRLQDFLSVNDLYVFTVNGFPYGDFHGKVIKEQVYVPDWATVERVEYTIMLARILALLLPENTSGSISTVPLAFGSLRDHERDIAIIIANLSEVAFELSRLFERTGRDIHIGLEPEPDCLLENTRQSIAFFRERLFAEGPRLMAQRHGCSIDEAEGALRRHIGLCVDTCHFAVQYESPATTLKQLYEAGIRISKIQLSAAMKLHPGKHQLSRLSEFADPVYLHQVKSRTPAGEIKSRGDLAEVLAACQSPNPAEEWRIHEHLPLYYDDDLLQTTSDDLDHSFFATAAGVGAEHWEIETYTYDLLPKTVAMSNLIESIAAEYAWVLARAGMDG